MPAKVQKKPVLGGGKAPQQSKPSGSKCLVYNKKEILYFMIVLKLGYLCSLYGVLWGVKVESVCMGIVCIVIG